jgi:hypothetical protein
MYLSDGTLALTVGGKRRFADLTFDALRSFARQAEISGKRVCVLADEMVEKTRCVWQHIKVIISNEQFITAGISLQPSSADESTRVAAVFSVAGDSNASSRARMEFFSAPFILPSAPTTR